MYSKMKPVMLAMTLATSPVLMSKAFAGEIDLNTNIHPMAEENETSPLLLKELLSTEDVYYAAVNGLRVRSTPEDSGKTMGLLSLNERVRLVDGSIINDKYVEVQIIRSVNKFIQSDKYYVALEFLSKKVVDYKEFTGKYFTILNVATETLRVYERQCLDNSCPHKMIMETEVVVGEDKNLAKEDKGKGRSILGSYRLTGWAKFYEDAEKHYPAWYRNGYPEIPSMLDNDWRDWFKNKHMPNGKDGSMRGAFGWYAGFVAPNAFGQWTHGTVGWGMDKDKYIQKTKKLVTNIVSNPRSSGCTRNNNEAVAFIRQLIDTGAPMIKIYAKEALADKSLSQYPTKTAKWDYILTKKAGTKSGREDSLKSLGITGQEADLYWQTKLNGGNVILDPKSSLNEILEVGTYTVDTEPTVIEYTPGEKMGKIKRSVGRKGNIYGVKSQHMYGTYYVDTGFIANYKHPTEILDWSGFEDEETPPFMDIKALK